MSTVKCELEFSSRDLIALRTALFTARNTQLEIIRFYEENPGEDAVTPMCALKEERDSLERLLHIFGEL